MKVLVACEVTAEVREAFTMGGHDAWSCDLLPSEKQGKHYQGDVMDIINDGWDMMIAFPPCTHLCVSGARWFKDKAQLQKDAVDFAWKLWTAPIEKVSLENPVGVLSTYLRTPDQIIQPWMFGHGETKATCLWLKNLPLLRPTNIVEGREHRIHQMAPGPNRAYERSRTYSGIAQAMAEQWGKPSHIYQERMCL